MLLYCANNTPRRPSQHPSPPNISLLSSPPTTYHGPEDLRCASFGEWSILRWSSRRSENKLARLRNDYKIDTGYLRITTVPEIKGFRPFKGGDKEQAAKTGGRYRYKRLALGSAKSQSSIASCLCSRRKIRVNRSHGATWSSQCSPSWTTVDVKTTNFCRTITPRFF